MSFEGYYQQICPNGHYYTCDVYTVGPCSDCGEGAAWSNLVDETNCDSVGEIPLHLLSKHFEIKPGVFKVPSREETEPLRHYRPFGESQLKPLSEAR